MILSLAFVSFFLLFFIVEFIKRQLHIHPEFTRKFVHIMSGIGAIFWSYYLGQSQFLGLTLIFSMLFLFLFKYKVFKSISLESRKTYGEITYLLGLLLLGFFIYSKHNLFILGILVLMVPDATAGLLSFIMKSGRKKAIHFSVYTVVAFLLLIIFLPWYLSFIAAILLGITELYSPIGLDNFTVPAIYIVLIYILRL